MAMVDRGGHVARGKRQRVLGKRYLRALRSLDPLERRMLLSSTVAVYGSIADQAVDSLGAFRFVDETSARIGDNGIATADQAVVIPFQLPAGQNVTAASLTIYLQSIANQSSVTGNVDVYGLGFRGPSDVLLGDYYEGSYGGDATDATPIQTAFFTPTSATGSRTTTAAGNAALVNYLNAQYAAGATPGSYVFLRLNAQSNQLNSRYWVISTSDNASVGQRPVLSITLDPPPPPPVDTTAPIISIASPASGAMFSLIPPAISGIAGTAAGDTTAVTVKIYAGTTATGAPVQTLTATADGTTGAFSISAAPLPQGVYTVQASQSDKAGNIGTSNAVSLTMFNTLPGDADGNSLVNFSDFTTMSNNFGTSTTAGPAVGDFNFDGTVNFADFVLLSNHFGQAFTAAPTNLAVHTTSSTSLHLSWTDNSSNETGFAVERSTDGVTFAPVTTTAANATSYDSTTGLSPNTTYFFRVLAANGAGNSQYTAVASNTTLPTFAHTLWVDLNSTASLPDGTYNKAYKTIATALSHAGAGDGVVVRGGTYKGQVNIGTSGTVAAPFTLTGAPGERTIISGFQAIGGWTLYSGNVYVTTVSTNPTSLYTGMTELEQARSPDGGWYIWQSTSTSGATTTITDTAHLTGIANLTGGNVELHNANGNLEQSYPILSADPVAGTITITATPGLAANDVYMVRDKLALLNQPGEWAAEGPTNGTYKLYYWPKSVGDLSATQTIAGSNSLISVTSGVHDVVIQGFEVTGAMSFGIDIENASDITVKNNLTHDNGNGIWFRWVTNSTISNNLSILNGTGITVASGTHILITQNEIAYNTTDGLVIAGDIHGNVPGDPGFSPSDDITASYNYIHNQSYLNHADGIQMYTWVSNVHIRYNLILNNEQGIMTEQVDTPQNPGTSDITGNVIWGSSASLIIWGSASYNWVFANNTIGGSGYGVFQMTQTGYTLNENVIADLVNANSYTGNRNLLWTTDPNGVIFQDPSYNNYTTIAAWHTFSGQDANSVKADPKFVNVPMVSHESNASGLTTTTLSMRDSVAGFAVGDHIEIAMDGVVRTITAINGLTITFDIPLPAIPLYAVEVYDWGTRTNYQWDTRLAAGSPGLTLSSTAGPVGSLIVMSQYQAGDFNGDGKRDIPLLPADLGYPPNSLFWPV